MIDVEATGIAARWILVQPLRVRFILSTSNQLSVSKLSGSGQQTQL